MPKDKWEQYAAQPAKGGDKWEQYSAPASAPAPQSGGSGGSWEPETGGEKFWRHMTTSIVPGVHGSLTPPKKDDESVTDYLWRLANTPLVPEGRAEREGHAYATSAPKNTDSTGKFLGGTYSVPRVEALKHGAAGAYADTAETARGFTTPLALSTLGLSKLAKGVGTAGKVARLLQPLVAGSFGLQGASQAASGIEDISDKGGMTPENAKEALGGTGQAILGGVGGRESITTRARVAAQEIAGAGREPVLLEATRRQAQQQERAQQYQESAEAASRENSKKLQEHQAKVTEAKAAYDKEMAEHQTAVAEKRQGHSDKVAAARKEWVQKAYEAKRLQAEHDAAQNKLASLAKGQQAYAKVIKDNVTSTYAKVKGSLDSRWNGLRDAIGADTPLDSTKLAGAIGKGRAMLQGAPADLKVFNDLMQQMETRSNEFIDGENGPVQRSLGWQEGRTHYSALGDKMYSGELPGNVRRAVATVRDAVDGELSRVAAQRGQGQQYSGLKKDWGKFEEDWRDRSSIAGGGSPLARVLDAKDPGFVMSQVTGKAGERMANTLGQYAKFGGNPASISRLRTMSEQVKQVPRIRVPETPGKFTAPAEPKMPAAPEAKATPKPPELRTAKRPRPVDPVDPIEVRRRKLTEMAGRPFRFYDLFPPYLAEHLMLKSPAFREWVASQPRNELKLQKEAP